MISQTYNYGVAADHVIAIGFEFFFSGSSNIYIGIRYVIIVIKTCVSLLVTGFIWDWQNLPLNLPL